MAKVKINGLSSGLRSIKRIVKEQAEMSMRDCMNDLARTSSEAAPLDDGDLEQAWDIKVETYGDKVYGQVRYEVWADAPNRSYDFNYAIWTHEEHYNLGKKSRQKRGGIGMSGKHYEVGRQYLTRVLDGEKETYRALFEKNIKDSLRNS